MSFLQRLVDLPVLGMGVSTEYGAAATAGALDPMELHRRHPQFANFLEVGIEVSKGLDAAAVAWVEAGLPTTYHFLDVNLDEPEDFDDAWLLAVRKVAARLRPAWMCGDAGLWHFGPRERGHMLLLPPILTEPAALQMAEGIARLREETGLEVLPENPPGQLYLGDMHLLDFFARVCELADTGMLLDCAHLAIYQRLAGLGPTDAFDGFPWDRVVEMHVAGASWGEVDGYRFVEDDHTTEVLPETWTIAQRAVEQASNLKALVFECERNGLEQVLPGFKRIERMLDGRLDAKDSVA